MQSPKVRPLASFLALLVASGCTETSAPLQTDRYSEQAFRGWLAADESRQEGFERFETFLAERDVANAVPPWQLLRTDANYAARCGMSAFEMPPEDKWSAIVPTLRLVRDEVIPVVGRVEVFAANRSDELNVCVNGARRSRHLAFAAVDLVAPERTDKRELFVDLCAMHRRIGPSNRMGLGAYFDPARPESSRQGRFHIDAGGFRTWGFGYTRESSACVTLG